MTDARSRILGRIRSAVGRPGDADPTAVAAELAALLQDPSVTQPALKLQDPIEEFRAKVQTERLAATIEDIGDDSNVVAAVRRYLEAEEAPLSLALPPDPSLEALDWTGVETHRALDPNEGSAISRAEWGIAETGSLVLFSSPEQPTLYAFLPLRHIVIASKSSIVPHMEDFWQAFHTSGRGHPRNINFVTGVSGTADIESKLVRGAHGPRHLHILLTD
ncbi:MAG: LutC/YkgG family protein [Alphaproteobacteria bacterium]